MTRAAAHLTMVRGVALGTALPRSDDSRGTRVDAIRAMSMPTTGPRDAATVPWSMPVAGIGRTGDPLGDRVVAELERDPAGGRPAAIDRLSASITFDPSRGTLQRQVPGATLRVEPGNSLTRMPAAQVDGLTTADFLAASQSTLAAASGAGLAGGLELVKAALAKDPRTGKDAYDRRIDRLEARKAELVRAVAGTSDRALQLELLVEANAIATQILLVQRDREKLEALERLLFALMCGVVPKHLIARMVELGMGGIVERAIEELVGSGRGISKSMSEQLHAVGADLGLSLHIAPAEHTFDAMEQADRRLAEQGTTLPDGRRVDRHGRLVSVVGELSAQGGSAPRASR